MYARGFIKEIEKAVKDRGCTKFVIANSAVNDGEKIDRFYGILGFKRLEVHYMKDLL